MIMFIEWTENAGKGEGSEPDVTLTIPTPDDGASIPSR